MHTFLADRLARVAKDWQQNLAALKELSAINMALFEASLQYWQVALSYIIDCTSVPVHLSSHAGRARGVEYSRNPRQPSTVKNFVERCADFHEAHAKRYGRVSGEHSVSVLNFWVRVRPNPKTSVKESKPQCSMCM